MGGISRFYGIVVYMYANDHGPDKHFHASYNGFYAKFHLDGTLVDGEDFPRKQARFIKKWASLRQSELEANWRHVEAHTQPSGIAPLDHK
ncbi:DUF4160 domain-containing protein [Bifidobacterium leontopitheci]|uniref:Transcriptional regulator n=1 Tax=Bifidobacterium leontopitheci TaxID=2650774 RepID=A0A6I1GPA6_9BIFI|nr:DUF4160 domain-containing protein [Bifidobacterium leontopitheci]KAB7791219.1 transcriptional regulator [Bifidobacterium leontopitheci]